MLCAFPVSFLPKRFSIPRQRADAEDTVQDALLSAYKHLSKFRGQARISTWLSAIVINSARMQLRRRSRQPHVPLDEQSTEQESHALCSAGGPWADARGGMSWGLTCRARSSVVATALNYAAESISTGRTGRPHHSRNRECSRSR
jgi:RNA polymerase sigma factor (sigma-70 family)